MVYRWLVTVILTLHFGYLVYLVLGGFLAWRSPKAVIPHVAAALWGVLIVFEWVDCPLTWAENWARQRCGEPALSAGFIDRYVTGVIYPPEYLQEIRLAVAVVVLGSWVGAYLLWRRRRAAADRAVRSGPTPA